MNTSVYHAATDVYHVMTGARITKFELASSTNWLHDRNLIDCRTVVTTQTRLWLEGLTLDIHSLTLFFQFLLIQPAEYHYVEIIYSVRRQE
jgi:hypothetical protein